MNAETLINFGYYFTPDGRTEIVEMMRDFKKDYGKDWIENFKEELPDFAFLVDLVANHPADQAFIKLQEYVGDLIEQADLSTLEKYAARSLATATLNGNYSQILETHAALREEIDKPRF